MLMGRLRRSEPKQSFESSITEFLCFPECWNSLPLSFVHASHQCVRHNVVYVKNKLLPKEENQESMAALRKDLSIQPSMTAITIISFSSCLSPHHKMAVAPWCPKHRGIASFKTKWPGECSAEAEIWTLVLPLACCTVLDKPLPSLTLCLHLYNGDSNSTSPTGWWSGLNELTPKQMIKMFWGEHNLMQRAWCKRGHTEGILLLLCPLTHCHTLSVLSYPFPRLLAWNTDLCHQILQDPYHLCLFWVAPTSQGPGSLAMSSGLGLPSHPGLRDATLEPKVFRIHFWLQSNPTPHYAALRAPNSSGSRLTAVPASPEHPVLPSPWLPAGRTAFLH